LSDLYKQRIELITKTPNKATPEELSKIVSELASGNAKIQLSDDKSIDLLVYSGPKTIDKERTVLDISRSKLKTTLREFCRDNNIDFGHMTFDQYLEDCTNTSTKKILEDDNGVQNKDAQFRGFKNKKGVKAFVGGVTRAVLLGVAFQEVGAIFNRRQQGVVESM